MHYQDRRDSAAEYASAIRREGNIVQKSVNEVGSSLLHESKHWISRAHTYADSHNSAHVPLNVFDLHGYFHGPENRASVCSKLRERLEMVMKDEGMDKFTIITGRSRDRNDQVRDDSMHMRLMTELPGTYTHPRSILNKPNEGTY